MQPIKLQKTETKKHGIGLLEIPTSSFFVVNVNKGRSQLASVFMLYTPFQYCRLAVEFRSIRLKFDTKTEQREGAFYIKNQNIKYVRYIFN